MTRNTILTKICQNLFGSLKRGVHNYNNLHFPQHVPDSPKIVTIWSINSKDDLSLHFSTELLHFEVFADFVQRNWPPSVHLQFRATPCCQKLATPLIR